MRIRLTNISLTSPEGHFAEGAVVIGGVDIPLAVAEARLAAGLALLVGDDEENEARVAAETLLGSSILPAEVEILADYTIPLGVLVCDVHRICGLSVEGWNALAEPAREALLQVGLHGLRSVHEAQRKIDHAIDEFAETINTLDADEKSARAEADDLRRRLDEALTIKATITPGDDATASTSTEPAAVASVTADAEQAAPKGRRARKAK